MFTDAHHRTYVFVAAFFWELTTSGISWGYPKLISRNWHGAPSNLDAALNYNGLTYFFKVNTLISAKIKRKAEFF